MASRLQEFLGKIPLITGSLLFLNIGVHIYLFLSSDPGQDYWFNAYLVLYRSEWYRIITCAFVHGGIFHIAMNMLSLVALGGMLEEKFGSVRFLWITILSLLMAGTTALGIIWLCSIALDPSYLFQSSVGYSGVLFSYLVIEATHANVSSRSIFGIFSVPTSWYPFLMLILLQFILPNISFSGHLGGLLTGYLLVSSVGNWIQPSTERLESFESCLVPSAVRRLPNFRPSTSNSLLHPSMTWGSTSCVTGCFAPLLSLVMAIWALLVSLLTPLWERIMAWAPAPAPAAVATVYEPLPADSGHDASALHGSSPSLPVATAIEMTESGRLDDAELGRAATNSESATKSAHARAMAAAAAMQRAGLSANGSSTGSGSYSPLHRNSPSSSLPSNGGAGRGAGRVAVSSGRNVQV